MSDKPTLRPGGSQRPPPFHCLCHRRPHQSFQCPREMKSPVLARPGLNLRSPRIEIGLEVTRFSRTPRRVARSQLLRSHSFVIANRLPALNRTRRNWARSVSVPRVLTAKDKLLYRGLSNLEPQQFGLSFSALPSSNLPLNTDPPELRDRGNHCRRCPG